MENENTKAEKYGKLSGYLFGVLIGGVFRFGFFVAFVYLALLTLNALGVSV